MPTIVYPPTIDYRWLYQRPQQIFKEIAALGYRVVFYNNPHYFEQKKKIIEQYPNFFLCTPDVPLESIDTNDTNDTNDSTILWVSYPPHVRHVGRYNEELVVFDALDDASDEFITWAKDLNKISSKADIILTTAHKLYNYHSKRHNNVHMCPNGTDYEHFSKAQKIFSSRPKDLPSNDRPIIGYYGAVAPWIDWNLVKHISASNKNFNFVIIGPLYGGFDKYVKAPNIYYLGRKEYSEIPDYLQYFDACIIPFKVTPMIEGCNPIKMYEYLSSGKPVIATNMPEAAIIPEIYIGRSNAEFNHKIHQALLEKSNVEKINARIEVAKKNSWQHRAKTAVDVIENTLNQRKL